MNQNNIFIEIPKDNKEIEDYYLYSNIINKDDEPNFCFSNFHNDNNYNENENNSFEQFLMEEKIKISQYNNNSDNLFLLNDIINPFQDQQNNFLGKKHNLNSVDDEEKNIFKKNRNNLNNYIFKISNDKNDNITHNITNETSSSNYNNNKITYSNFRNDSLLIKFKSFLGKSFIKFMNNKLKNLTKRKLKLFSFNYKLFTLNVSYGENKKWLNEKIKNLLIFGNEPNQIKNQKTLKSIERRKEQEFNEVKSILELSYKEIIERFYISNYFYEFQKDKKNRLLNDNFQKAMNISLLEKNGFINFILSRKGNNGKKQ